MSLLKKNNTAKIHARRRPQIVSWGLLLAALGMMVYGAKRGEVQVLFTKAIYICMECIGLG